MGREKLQRKSKSLGVNLRKGQKIFELKMVVLMIKYSILTGPEIYAYLSYLQIYKSPQRGYFDLYCLNMNEEKEEHEVIHYKNHRQKKCWEKLFNRRFHYSELPDRKIITNIPDMTLDDNSVETSKYNVLTFLPLNLIQQFTKPSNIYFLLIGLLQMIPEITVSEGKPTMFLPLTIVVAVSMAKDFIQDWQRHKSDRKENESQVQVITEIGVTKRKWQSLRVGELVRVRKEQYFPCDMLLLHHSKEAKVVYVETKNLDGENNLKIKRVPECLSQIFIDDCLELANLRYCVSYEKPNPFLSVFNGNIQVHEKKFMLDNNNLILRGCSLKINEFIVGVCLYNGHESKVMLNSANPKPKRSYVENYLNKYFRYIFLFQLTVTLASALIYGVILALHYQQYTYFNETHQFFVATVFTWGSWFISFSNFIPISLLVTVEFVRFGQGKVLGHDKKCKSKMVYTEVQTSSVNQELGQIQYILSDKTGTLTKNQMEFKFLYVDGRSYGDNQQLQFAHPISDSLLRNFPEDSPKEVDIQQETQEEPKIKLEFEEDIFGDTTNRATLLDKNQSPHKKTLKKMKKDYQLQQIKKKKTLHVDFPKSQKSQILARLESGNQKQREKLRLALVHLALCHNVISEGEAYTSSSPDEVALVSFARFIGFKFLRKNDENEVEIQEVLPGQKTKLLKYSLLHVLEFSSERKRMSVIVSEKQKDKQRILLFCKGADDVILSRLINKKKSELDEHLSKVHDQLFNYACKGLRTLVLAYRVLDPELYQAWQHQYNEAWTIISSERHSKVGELQSEIEKELELVGLTAIQDKLQNEVKEVISQLKKSSIKVWMLTGDKKETAVSIGYSCGLLEPTNQLITLDCDPENAKELISNVHSMLHLLEKPKVTVMSGDLITKLETEGQALLQQILQASVSVICCRVSPKGKEQIVNMVKPWGRTLAVGDGANDVNMINSAHVGVGVRGIEGSQATRAADYVISEFRILQRLVLYYGLNFYHRNCGVVLFTLYKNIIVTFPILFYGPLSIESATYIYQNWIFQFFNISFVALPIIYFGLFDTLYSQKELLARPYLYKQGQKGKYFSRSILIGQVLTSILVSVFLVFSAYFITNLTVGPNGLLLYEEWCGMLIFNVVVVTANIRIWNMSHQFNLFQGLLCIFGVASYYLMFFLIELLFYTDVKNTLIHMVSSWLYWLLVIFYTLAIEGWYFLRSRLQFLQIKKTEASQRKKFELQEKQEEIHKSSVKLEDISQQKRMSMGGYAFAEDEERSLHLL